jgi:rhombotail lipoprotein
MRKLVVCLPLVAALATASAGCAANAQYASARAAAYAPNEPATPVPLDHSLFARDPQGSLTEEALQQILSSPIELDLPARVGVVPVLGTTDFHGPGPDYQTVPAGTSALAQSLRGADAFTLVTEVMPIPSGSLGVEALRQVAARYALRYIVLYKEQISQDSRVNALASLYATVIGALFIPGQTLEVSGYIEASMLDVKTGLLLFTVRRAVIASRSSNLWHTDHKLGQLQASVAVKFAPTLGEDFRSDMVRFADAAKVENERRLAAHVQASKE